MDTDVANDRLPAVLGQMHELKTAVLTAYIPAEERRKMEYKILELEADVRLAALA